MDAYEYIHTHFGLRRAKPHDPVVTVVGCSMGIAFCNVEPIEVPHPQADDTNINLISKCDSLYGGMRSGRFILPPAPTSAALRKSFDNAKRKLGKSFRNIDSYALDIASKPMRRLVATGERIQELTGITVDSKDMAEHLARELRDCAWLLNRLLRGLPKGKAAYTWGSITNGNFGIRSGEEVAGIPFVFRSAPVYVDRLPLHLSSKLRSVQ